MTAYTPHTMTLHFPGPVEGPRNKWETKPQPRAVVLDASGVWMLVGVYTSPSEALSRAVTYSRTGYMERAAV